MSEDKELISAWLDDAINNNEADALRVDHGKQSFSTASRYQMIGEALRGRVTDAAMIDISERVHEAIQREALPVRSSRPVPPRRESRPLFDFGAWLRPVGGLAVAATVAMVMVVTLTDQQNAPDEALVADTGQQPVRALPVSNTAPVYSQSGIVVPAVNLNSYVNEHSEFAARDTLQGMMPYARSVSYGAVHSPDNSSTVGNRQIVNNPGK